MKIKITASHRNSEICRCIAKSLEPDNLLAPPTVKVNTKTTNNVLSVSVTCNKLETFMATVDDLLTCMDAAKKTLEVVQTDRCA
jgi:hypothetical protein